MNVSIGYELYCKEIDRAVKMLKGEEVGELRSDISIDLPIGASIPASYIADESLRLDAYRKIASIMDSDDAADIIDELTDRYGELPEDAVRLIEVAEIRALAEKIGIVHMSQNEKWIRIKLSDKVKIHPYVLVMAKSEYGEKLMISDGRETVISLYMGKTIDSRRLLEFMRYLCAVKADAEAMQEA